MVVAGAAIVLVVFRGFRPKNLFLGFVFGAVISALNFWFLSRDISKTRYAPQDSIEGWLLARFLLRYLLIGFGFAVCLINPHVHIVGFLIGFVACQLAIFWSMFRGWDR